MIALDWSFVRVCSCKKLLLMFNMNTTVDVVHFENWLLIRVGHQD